MTKLSKAFDIIVRKAGGLAVSHFKKSFTDGGFTDASLKPWDKPKRTFAKRDSPAKTRGILIKSGLLRRSVRVTKQSGLSIYIGSDVPYTQVHNEGGEVSIPAHEKVLNFSKKGNKTRFAKAKKAQFSQKVSIKARSFKMPQRQFIGESKALETQILKMIEKEILSIF